MAADRGEPGRGTIGGGIALAYHQLVGLERNGGYITVATIADVRSGSVERINPRLVVSAAGAWAGRVAGLAGAKLDMSPGKGTMLVFTVRFEPDAAVYSDAGRLVAREGALVTLDQTRPTDAAGTFEDPYHASGLIFGGCYQPQP